MASKKTRQQGRKAVIERGLLGETINAMRDIGILTWPQVGLVGAPHGVANIGGVYRGRAVQILVLEGRTPNMAEAAWLDISVQSGAFAAVVGSSAESALLVELLREKGPACAARWRWTGNAARMARATDDVEED